jgi:hypothetical protein
MTMKKAIQSALLAGVLLLGAKSAFAAVNLDCFNYQANNAIITVPANGGIVDVTITGNGGVFVETAPYNPTDRFSTVITDASNFRLDDSSGVAGYARAYLRTGAGTVRIRNYVLTQPAFTAVVACTNTFPRHNL